MSGVRPDVAPCADAASSAGSTSRGNALAMRPTARLIPATKTRRPGPCQSSEGLCLRSSAAPAGGSAAGGARRASAGAHGTAPAPRRSAPRGTRPRRRAESLRSLSSILRPAGVIWTIWRRRSAWSRCLLDEPRVLELVEQPDELALVVAERVGDRALRLARALVEHGEDRVVVRVQARPRRTRRGSAPSRPSRAA